MPLIVFIQCEMASCYQRPYEKPLYQPKTHKPHRVCEEYSFFPRVLEKKCKILVDFIQNGGESFRAFEVMTEYVFLTLGYLTKQHMHIQCFIKKHIPAQRHNRYICSGRILFIFLLQILPEPHGKRPKDLLPL